MGKGVKELLDAIDEYHSIKSASKATGISYPKAIRIIKTLGQELGFSVVVSTKGGSTYGGTQLTEKGREVLECYRQIEADVTAYAEKIVQERFQFE